MTLLLPNNGPFDYSIIPRPTKSFNVAPHRAPDQPAGRTKQMCSVQIRHAVHGVTKTGIGDNKVSVWQNLDAAAKAAAAGWGRQRDDMLHMGLSELACL